MASDIHSKQIVLSQCMTMDLSIIIVNWKSKNYLRKCIGSILRHTQGVELEIIVIDSGSFDGCENMLRKVCPQALFIQSDQNIGFAKANNEAFKISCGRYLLFLNPDTEIKGNSIQLLIRQLESLPHAGVVGPLLLNTDMSIQTSCIRKFPTLLNQVLDIKGLKRLFPMSVLWGIAPLFNRLGSSVEVDAISGACIMISRLVFESVGMFSTDYFMYSEDIDLCYKIRQAGLKTYYVPDAMVVHHGSGSSSISNFSTFSCVMMVESRIRFFRKTRSWWYCLLYRFSIIMVGIIRIGVMLAIFPALMLCGKSSVIKSPLKKWIAIMRWAIGFEKWVKNY